MVRARDRRYRPFFAGRSCRHPMGPGASSPRAPPSAAWPPGAEPRGTPTPSARPETSRAGRQEIGGARGPTMSVLDLHHEAARRYMDVTPIADWARGLLEQLDVP